MDTQTAQYQAAAEALYFYALELNPNLPKYDGWDDMPGDIRGLYLPVAKQAVDAAHTVGVSRFTSDGNHTFDELYHYRALYNALAARYAMSMGYKVIRSWRHHDGKPCFGGGWFIVTIELPHAGRVSNHYKEGYWDMFRGIPEVGAAPEWDGSTSEMMADYVKLFLNSVDPLDSRHIKVGDLVFNTGNRSLDPHKVIAVGVDWIWLDFQQSEFDQGGSPTRLPKSRYRKVDLYEMSGPPKRSNIIKEPTQ